jgi:sortase A
MNARIDRHSRRKSHFSKIGFLLIAAGLVVASYPLLTVGYGRLQQYLLLRQAEQAAAAYREKALLERKSNAALMKTTPKGYPGKWPTTKIVIEKIGVKQIVQEGIGAEILQQSPGHYPKTVNPGQTGWCAIAGHRITFSAPFDRLNELTPGDKIVLETNEARFTYLFDSIVTVSDTATLDMPRTDKSHVMLTTCEPKTGSSHRLIARGTLAPYPASKYLVPPKP